MGLQMRILDNVFLSSLNIVTDVKNWPATTALFEWSACMGLPC
jgi:hypothetical protein